MQDQECTVVNVKANNTISPKEVLVHQPADAD
jgi:hypothetical protein